jgi:hypothetical protein
VRTSVPNDAEAELEVRDDADDVPEKTLRVFAECRRTEPPDALEVYRSTPTCRSATLRAKSPTNGERAEPPGSVATRSLVDVESSRGPVRVDTVRRTLCRRSSARSANVAVVSGDGERRSDGAVERPTLGNVERAVDDGEVELAEAAPLLPVSEEDVRVAGVRAAGVRTTTVGVAVDRVAVDRVAVDGDVRDDLVRVVVVGAVERDD